MLQEFLKVDVIRFAKGHAGRKAKIEYLEKRKQDLIYEHGSGDVKVQTTADPHPLEQVVVRREAVEREIEDLKEAVQVYEDALSTLTKTEKFVWNQYIKHAAFGSFEFRMMQCGFSRSTAYRIKGTAEQKLERHIRRISSVQTNENGEKV